jgi:hypothetical protein
MAIAFLAAVAGRAAASPTERTSSRANGPAFDPIRFFSGRTHSSGVFEDRRGAPTKRVRTVTSGRVTGGVLRIEQDLYIAGEPRQHRSWRIRRLGANQFEGTANDMIGSARGEARGNHFTWTFTLALRPGNPLYNVRITQHMYLQPDGRTMINRSAIRKLGILIAQVTEQFWRGPPRESAR